MKRLSFTLALLILLTCAVVAEDETDEVITPGKVPPQFKEAFDMLEARGLCWGAVQYTPETIAALAEKGLSKKDDKWFERRTSFFTALMKAEGFAAYPGHDGKSELEPAKCGDEFLVLTLPNAKLDAATVAKLAGENGLELIEFVEMPASEGLRTIDPGFSEEAVKEFWKKGRKVNWLLAQPVEKVEDGGGTYEKTTSGEETLRCTESGDKVWLRRSYKTTSSTPRPGGGSGGGGGALFNPVEHDWNHLLINRPRHSHYLSLPLLSALSTQEKTTLKIGEKEYACRKFTMRKSYATSDGKIYGVGEFYFCDDVPGVALKAVWTSYNGEETKTWLFTFKSTTEPE